MNFGEIKRRVQQVKDLPTLPQMAQKIIELRMNPNADSDISIPLKTRASYFSGSRNVTMITKLYCGPNLCKRYLPPNVCIDYQFEMQPHSYYTLHKARDVPADKYKYKIKQMYIMTRRVVVSPSVQMAHAKLLESNNLLYPFKYLECRTMEIPKGSYGFKFPNVFQGKVPSTAIVAFTRTDAYQGNVGK